MILYVHTQNIIEYISESVCSQPVRICRISKPILQMRHLSRVFFWGTCTKWNFVERLRKPTRTQLTATPLRMVPRVPLSLPMRVQLHS